MKKRFLYSLFCGAFLGAFAFSAVAQLNPTDERFEQVFQPSFSRLTPQGPAVAGGGGSSSTTTSSSPSSSSSKRLQDPQYRSSKGYINISSFVKDANHRSLSEGSSLQRAQLFHSSLYDINNLKRQLAYLKTNLINYKLRERRLADFEKCMLKRIPEQFSKQFINPEAVWAAIRKEALKNYDGVISQPAVSERLSEIQKKFYAGEDSDAIANADISPEDEADLAGTSDDSIDAMKSSLSNWYIGRGILMELYANQDKYEDRKGADRPSFEAWKDQKYLYDKKIWEPKYNAIKAACKVTTEPVISDDKKYDYYFYEDVAAAHKAYLATLPKECLLALPEKVKKAPEVMYRPLPPADEIVALLLDSRGNLREIYPAVPEPWLAFAESNCTLFNPNGEMAERFTCNAGTGEIFLRDDAETGKPKSDLISANVLSRLFTLYSEQNDAYSLLAEYIDLVEVLTDTLNTYAETYGIKLKDPQKMNFYSVQGLDEIFKIFTEAQDKELKKVAKDLGDKVKNKEPTIAQLKADPEFAMYYALSYDTKGDMDVTATSAPYVRVFVKTLNEFRTLYLNAEGKGLVAALQGMNRTINADAGVISTNTDETDEDSVNNEETEMSEEEKEALDLSDAVKDLFTSGSSSTKNKSSKTGEEIEYKKLAGMIVLQELTNKSIEGEYQEKLIADLTTPLDTKTCLSGGIIGIFPVIGDDQVKTEMSKILDKRKIPEEQAENGQ